LFGRECVEGSATKPLSLRDGTSYRKARTSEARSGSTVAGLFGRAACGEPNETPVVHEHDPVVVE